MSHDPAMPIEAWAHQGPPKSAQRHKVLADALKLNFVNEALGGGYRKVLCFSDTQAAAPFLGRSWYAAALAYHHVDVEVVELLGDSRERIRQAQRRQYR